MPVLTSSDQMTPRSILRHRPIGSNGTLIEPPRVPRASRTHTQKPAATTTAPSNIPVWKQSGKQQAQWRQRALLVGIGAGMLLVITLGVLGQLLVGWIGTSLDDLHYGRPRTSQVDAVVGQGDSRTHPSHFIALNLAGQVEVIDFPGGDASHAKVYLGPHLYGQNASLVPVTLQFVDTRHNHQLDMVVLFQGEQIIFRNSGGSFQAPPASSLLGQRE
jgi:hypothetical protein